MSYHDNRPGNARLDMNASEPTEGSRSGVVRAFNNLESEITQLAKEIANLEERLTPVLTKPDPKPDKSADVEEGRGKISPIASDLYVLANLLALRTLGIVDLRERIDL